MCNIIIDCTSQDVPSSLQPFSLSNEKRKEGYFDKVINIVGFWVEVIGSI
jgi:hypothetical protein